MENATTDNYKKFVKIAKIVSCAVSFALMILTVIGIFFVGYKDVFWSSSNGVETQKSGFFDFFYSKYRDIHPYLKERISMFNKETDYKINILMSAFVPLIFTTLVLGASCVITLVMFFLALNKIVKSLNEEKTADIGKYVLISIVSYVFAILVMTGYAYYESRSEYTNSYISYSYSLTRRFNAPTNVFLSIIVVFGLMLLVLRQFENKIEWNGKKIISFLFSGLSVILLVITVIIISLKFTRYMLSEDDEFYSSTYSQSYVLLVMLTNFDTELDFSSGQWNKLWKLQMIDNFAFIFGAIALVLSVVAFIRIVRVFMGKDKTVLDLVLAVTIFVFVLTYSILSIIAIIKMNKFLNDTPDGSYSSTFSFPYQIIVVAILSLVNAVFNIIEYVNCHIAKSGDGSKNAEETTGEVFEVTANNGIKTGEKSEVSREDLE